MSTDLLSALLAADTQSKPLSTTELKAIVARMGVQPGTTIAVREEIENLLEYGVRQRSLAISAQVQDSYNPGKIIPITFNKGLPSWMTFNSEESFARFVRATGHEFVTHEWDEWFKLDGVLVHDPHAQDAA